MSRCIRAQADDPGVGGRAGRRRQLPPRRRPAPGRAASTGRPHPSSARRRLPSRARRRSSRRCRRRAARRTGADLAAGKIELARQEGAAGRRCRLRGLRPGPVRHRAAAGGEGGGARRADGAHAGGAHLCRRARHVEELSAGGAVVRARRRARRSRGHARLRPDAGRGPGRRQGPRGRGPLLRERGRHQASARQLQPRAAVPEGRRQAREPASRADAHALCRRVRRRRRAVRSRHHVRHRPGHRCQRLRGGQMDRQGRDRAATSRRRSTTR